MVAGQCIILTGTTGHCADGVRAHLRELEAARDGKYPGGEGSGDPLPPRLPPAVSTFLPSTSLAQPTISQADPCSSPRRPLASSPEPGS